MLIKEPHHDEANPVSTGAFVGADRNMGCASESGLLIPVGSSCWSKKSLTTASFNSNSVVADPKARGSFRCLLESPNRKIVDNDRFPLADVPTSFCSKKALTCCIRFSSSDISKFSCMTAMNMLRTIKYPKVNQSMKNVAPIQAVLYEMVYSVTWYITSVQFSLESTWYIPRNEFQMV